MGRRHQRRLDRAQRRPDHPHGRLVGHPAGERSHLCLRDGADDRRRLAGRLQHPGGDDQGRRRRSGPRQMAPAQGPANTKIFVPNAATIDEGYIQSCTATSITVVFGSVTNNVYAAGDKVCTTLPFRAVGTAVFSTSTGAAGGAPREPALIPLVNAQTLGFAGSSKILIRDVGDPTITEQATLLSVDNVKITCAAYLTKSYVSGSLVMQAGSGEGKFWLR